MERSHLMELAVYVINLPRSEDRRQRMTQQLDHLGLPYTLFPAVDGTARWEELAHTLDADAFDRNTGRPALPGEVGVYHSHLGVWRDFVATGRPVALVLEDDVVFHDDILAALDAALAARDSWDLLKLNHIRAKQPLRIGTAGRWSLNAYRGPFTGFGGYLITRELALRLGAEMLPIRRPIDREADRVHVHRFRHLGLDPFPSHVEDHGQSTITGTNFASVKKRPWYRRLPGYRDRVSTLIGKARYLRQIKPQA
jgi:glycosyl transferase, family 25